MFKPLLPIEPGGQPRTHATMVICTTLPHVPFMHAVTSFVLKVQLPRLPVAGFPCRFPHQCLHYDRTGGDLMCLFKSCMLCRGRRVSTYAMHAISLCWSMLPCMPSSSLFLALFSRRTCAA